MSWNQISVATITLVRSAEEDRLLRQALQQLSALPVQVFVTDGGSGNDFVSFLNSLPNFTVLPATANGLWNQVQSSIHAAASTSPFVLYTEPDKLNFFANVLPSFGDQLMLSEQAGVVLASRTKEAMETFPAFQRFTENTINVCCAEITGKSFDYTYGPFIMNSKLAAFSSALPEDIGWGWRPFVFCAAHLKGLLVEQVEGPNECPPNQRHDDSGERIYRMKQLHQNIEGIVLATRLQSEA